MNTHIMEDFNFLAPNFIAGFGLSPAVNTTEPCALLKSVMLYHSKLI